MTLSCWVSLLYFSSYFLVSDEGVKAEGGRGARRAEDKGRTVAVLEMILESA